MTNNTSDYNNLYFEEKKMEKYEQTDRETEKQLKEAIRSAEKQLKMAMADYHKYILKGHYITLLKKYAGKQIKKSDWLLPTTK